MTSSIDLPNLPSKTAHFSQIWPFIQVGVHQLMDFPEKISATEFMNLSVTLNNFVMRSRHSSLDLQKKLKDIFVERVQLIAKEAAKMFDVDLVRYYVKEFHRYKTGVERVNRVFALYNRQWGKKAEEGSVEVILPVYSLALTSWEKNGAMVIQGNEAKLTSTILQLIMKERNGEEIEEDLVKTAIDSFIALDVDDYRPGDERLGFYAEEFEVPFLQATADYYKHELERIFQSENFITEYLNKVEENLLDEERRAKRYLPQKTHDKVIRTLLISDHCGALAQVLLQTGDDEMLRGMYTLLSRIKPDGLEPLKKSFGVHVMMTTAAFLPSGTGDYSVNTNDVQSLPGQQNLSDIHQRHLKIVKNCFRGDENFCAGLSNLDSAFGKVKGGRKKKGKLL